MHQLQPNTLLQGGRYKIINTLGQGGFGITYLAIQIGLERKVAVKEFFMKELCNRDEATDHVTIGTEGSRETVNRFREKFLKEARNIARLNHPNIVSIFDVFEENGTAYYVMEYAEKGSLADNVKQEGYLSEPVAIRYIKQVAEALDYIHQRKMNHLDVKPANIMLNEKDEVVLIDFGLSKQYDAKTGDATSTTPVGISNGYAPIEQYRQGGVSEFSPQADIYSLGATFYKLVTGITPPEASVLLDEYDDLERNNNISDNAWNTIKKAMVPSRKKRLPSIAEFLRVLQQQGVEKQKAPQIVKPPVTNMEPDIEEKEIGEEDTVLYGHHVPPKRKDVLTFNVNGIQFKMVTVEAGIFMMGATDEQMMSYFDEKPVHEVTLSNDYMMGDTHVTLELWNCIMGSIPSNSLLADNTPVTNVSWHDAMMFISELNRITGNNFRLPTEAEWEFAARGGNKTNNYQFSGSNNCEFVAWSSSNSKKPMAVKRKPANELGLYDMSGNVWEWCSDWHDRYEQTPVVDPKGPDNGSMKACRGGSFYNSNNMCRTAIRLSYLPNSKHNNVGFRLALTI